jgi:hypothetical protein
VSAQAAPDFASPIVGWRMWSITAARGRHRLCSPLFRVVWPPTTELRAVCDARGHWPWRRRRQDHVVPVARCGCGLHAMAAPGYLSAYILPPASSQIVRRAIGRVSLWGRVVEGSCGWRAEAAFPAEIWLPQADSAGHGIDDVDAIAMDLADYGVRVHVCDAMTPRRVLAMLSTVATETGAAPS